MFGINERIHGTNEYETNTPGFMGLHVLLHAGVHRVAPYVNIYRGVAPPKYDIKYESRRDDM